MHGHRASGGTRACIASARRLRPKGLRTVCTHSAKTQAAAASRRQGRARMGTGVGNVRRLPAVGVPCAEQRCGRAEQFAPLPSVVPLVWCRRWGAETAYCELAATADQASESSRTPSFSVDADIAKAELVNATHGQPGSASVRNNGAGIQAGLCGLPQGSIVAMEATGKHHGLMAQRAHHAGMRVYEGRQSNGTTDARARIGPSSLGFAALRLRRIHTAWTRASAFSQSAQT